MSGLLIPDPLNIGIYPDPLSKGIYVAGGGSGPIFFRDDFDRANSSSLGAGWVEHPDATLSIFNETMVGVDVGGIARFEHDLGTPDHFAKFDPVGNVLTSICVRMQGGDISSDTDYYMASYNFSTTRFRIIKVVTGGGNVTLADEFNLSSTPTELKLEVETNGGSVDLRLYDQADVLRASATDSSSPFLTGNYTGIDVLDIDGGAVYFEAGALA